MRKIDKITKILRRKYSVEPSTLRAFGVSKSGGGMFSKEEIRSIMELCDEYGATLRAHKFFVTTRKQGRVW